MSLQPHNFQHLPCWYYSPQEIKSTRLWRPPMAAYVKQVSWKSAKCFKAEMVRLGHTDTQHGDLNNLLCYAFSTKVHYKSDRPLYVRRWFKCKHYVTFKWNWKSWMHPRRGSCRLLGYPNVARPINLSIFHSRTHARTHSISQSTKQPICPVVCHDTICLWSHYGLLRNTSNTRARALTHTVSYIHLLFTSSGLYYYYWYYYTHSSPNNSSFHISNLP